MTSPVALAPVLAIAGPTASGKTAAALHVAQHHELEIISIDSALVYRDMDIGTAKPSLEERAWVPHHLIDVRSPTASYSAADCVRDVGALIAQIQARGRRVLLVGGTMLYFKALQQGLDDLPPANEPVRAALALQAEREGWPALHARLQQIDPVTAHRLACNDSQRIQRALEVYEITGQAISAFHSRQKSHTGGVAFELLSLEPRDRAFLHERIAQRFDAMLAQGLVDEVRGLRERYPLHAALPAMRCVGYRQVWQSLEGAESMQSLRDRGIAATRQLAKRQLTWLRSMAGRQVVACDEAQPERAVLHWAQGHWG